MSKRSGVPETEKELAELSLESLNKEIERCQKGSEQGGTSQGRKAFFKRLVWLEKMKEKLHDVEAPHRLWRNRDE